MPLVDRNSPPIESKISVPGLPGLTRKCVGSHPQRPDQMLQIVSAQSVIKGGGVAELTIQEEARFEATLDRIEQ